MAKPAKPRPIVAELGRPETPRETAARKAHDSRMYRERKTVNNLVFSLIVCLAMVLLIVLMVPRGTGGFDEVSLNVNELAADASESAGRTLAAPAVPEGWKAKQATLKQSEEIIYWMVTYTTADGAFASVVQAFTQDGTPVDDDWIADTLENQSPTGNEQLAGVDWTVYDHPERSADDSNVIFGLESTPSSATKDSTLIVSGTDDPGVLRVLATEVVASLNNGGSA